MLTGGGPSAGALVMTAHDGQKYFCLMPPSASKSGDDSDSGDGSSSGSGSGSGSAADADDKKAWVAEAAKREEKSAAARKAARDGKAITELLEPLVGLRGYTIRNNSSHVIHCFRFRPSFLVKTMASSDTSWHYLPDDDLTCRATRASTASRGGGPTSSATRKRQGTPLSQLDISPAVYHL